MAWVACQGQGHSRLVAAAAFVHAVLLRHLRPLCCAGPSSSPSQQAAHTRPFGDGAPRRKPVEGTSTGEFNTGCIAGPRVTGAAGAHGALRAAALAHCWCPLVPRQQLGALVQAAVDRWRERQRARGPQIGQNGPQHAPKMGPAYARAGRERRRGPKATARTYALDLTLACAHDQISRTAGGTAGAHPPPTLRSAAPVLASLLLPPSRFPMMSQGSWDPPGISRRLRMMSPAGSKAPSSQPCTVLGKPPCVAAGAAREAVGP